jgi:hypothetical protein
MGQRFVNAWHRLGRGVKVRGRHLTYPDLAAMLSAQSPKRLELLRAVRPRESSQCLLPAGGLSRSRDMIGQLNPAGLA